MNCLKIFFVVLLGMCGSAIAKPQPLTWDDVGTTMDEWGRKINDFGRKAADAARGMCQYINSMPQYPSYPAYQNYPPQYYPSQDPRFNMQNQPNRPWASGPGFSLPSYPTNVDTKPVNNKPDSGSVNNPRAFPPPPYIPPSGDDGTSNDIPSFPSKPRTLEQDDMNKVESPSEVSKLFKRGNGW